MQFYWFLFVLLLVASSLCAEVAPIVNVPVTTKGVKIDGIYRSEEWKDAALLQKINILGTTQPAPQQTKVFLKCTEEFLYVGVQCFENQKGYPAAHKRKATDYLGEDDAVQVVLGVADERVTRDVLMMGGYEGAMNTEVANADHYYQFTVNAAGALSRTYNEGVLERPLFESAVTNSKGFWFVEMKIPFASAGIDRVKNRRIFFNFYRFRPPDTFGWLAKAYGGYTPMSFATLRLSSAVDRTVEDAYIRSKSQNLDEKQKDTASFEYYPLTDKVIASIDGYNEKGNVALLQVEGVGEKRLKIVSEKTYLAVTVPKSIKSDINAVLKITSSDGKVQFLDEKVFKTDFERPSWFGNDVSKDYLKSKVPAPWTKPLFSGNTVKLNNKALKFGNNGLFSSIMFSDGDLLAGGSEIVLKINGKAVRTPSSRMFTKVRNNQAIIQSSSQFDGGNVEVRSVVDYDGFTVVKMRVNGIDPAAISALSVKIPVKSEHARFVYRETAQTVRELTGFGWQGKAGPVWVGGHEKGLSFDFDTPVFLSANQRSQIQVVEQKGKTWLKINLVDAKGQVKRQSNIFRFMLQPTPTRNPSLDKTGICHKTALWFEEWTDYQGYPDLSKMDKVKERSTKAHDAGLLQMIYFGQVLASNAPGFMEFKNDLLAPPERGWYKRAYDPGKDIVCYVSCARGAFGDLLLDGIQKLSDQGDIDGVYMDGTSVPWDCDNPSHIYCAGRPEIGWDSEDFTPYIGTRNFLKRLRGIFDRKNKPFYMMSHTGGAINIATMSLCDGHYEGEQLARYRHGYRLPLSTFASGYCGRPWGFRTDLLPMRPVYSNEEMRTLGLLHDGAIGNGPYGDVGGAALEERIYGDFQKDAEVKYYPYWNKQPHIDKNNNNVLASYYRKSDSAMLVLGNLTWEDQDVTVDLSYIFSGKPLYVTDVVNQVRVPVDSNKLSIRLKMHRYAAYRIDTRENATIPQKEAVDADLEPITFPATKLSSEDWQLAQNRAGVGIEREYKMADKPGCIKMTSTKWMAEANIRLEKYPIGKNGHIKLKVQHSGILKISIGDSGFYFGGPWMTFNLDAWNSGNIYQPTAVHDRPVEIVLSIRDGLLDATYDGKPLASGLELAGVNNRSILSLATWADHWLAFDLGEISSEPIVLYEDTAKHPVL